MEYKQVIIIRSDLGMGKGKIASQSSHASLSAYEKTLIKDPKAIDEWKDQGQAKIVLKVGSKQELLEWFEKLKNLFPTALIKDAGRTQIPSGEPTAVGIGPVPESEINKFTKELKLL
ncbi:MAG: peptidyl-tRNA hydrolase Pth2 [Candidatus Diapherotrites archaeon]